MQQQQRPTYLQQHFYLVTIIYQPLRIYHLLQTTVLLLRYQRQTPTVRVLLHHVVTIHRLHKRVRSQLQSIGIIQFLHQR